MTRIAPPGPRVTATGTRFEVRAQAPARLELCLFDTSGDPASEIRLPMESPAPGRWQLDVPDCEPGRLYGLRAWGPQPPLPGDAFDPGRILLDPWAPAVEPRPALGRPLGVTVARDFDWGEARRPRTAWAETVIYECHVKGMTQLHPDIAPELRGRYLGLAQTPIVEHLRSLGVTAVELMPVQQSLTEPALAQRGLTNYWGYNPLAFMAPDVRFASGSRGQQVQEFKAMVRALHAAGLEVILDLVFNHTVEGGADGPTLSLRGLDRGFYRLDPEDPGTHLDFTGCGNTLDLSSPAALDLVLDSLRYWAVEMRVDGFRFDLATTLGRGTDAFYTDGPLFRAIAADPDLAALKLIAEPWDLGPAGYRLGDFPPGWAQWNDRFRDTTRRFWRGDADTGGDFAERLRGSADLLGAGGGPSINYVTCHDGFTLRDLVSYERKRNEDNGEGNRDGAVENHSSNWGAEGPSDDPEIEATRGRIRRALLATTLLARGVPMLSHGDELGRTQEGNSNPYCHDSPLTWCHWAGDEDHALVTTIRLATTLRQRFAESYRKPVPAAIDPRDPRSRVVAVAPCAGLLLLLNPSEAEERWPLAGEWRVCLDTARPFRVGVARDSVAVAGRSLLALEEIDRAPA